MKKIYALILFFLCVLPTGTCATYQLIGTEALSEELIARQYSLDEHTRPASGYLGRKSRRDLPTDVAPLLFASVTYLVGVGQSFEIVDKDQ